MLAGIAATVETPTSSNSSALKGGGERQMLGDNGDAGPPGEDQAPAGDAHNLGTVKSQPIADIIG